MINKEELKGSCVQALQQKIDVLQSSIREAQNSSNNETKSTAGDKHETSRAMAQLEVERLSTQLSNQTKLMTLLSSLPTDPMDKAQRGSLVITDKGVFYLGVALGAIKLKNQAIMTLGMGAPISQLMLNSQAGESFSFNGNKYHIKEIF
jgi:hypothetical protein